MGNHEKIERKNALSPGAHPNRVLCDSLLCEKDFKGKKKESREKVRWYQNKEP